MLVTPRHEREQHRVEIGTLDGEPVLVALRVLEDGESLPEAAASRVAEGSAVPDHFEQS